MKRFFTVVSVIMAAPWAILSTRSCRARASLASTERTMYSTCACGCTTFGELPPASVMA